MYRTSQAIVDADKWQIFKAVVYHFSSYERESILKNCLIAEHNDLLSQIINQKSINAKTSLFKTLKWRSWNEVNISDFTVTK